ncbi:DMT family transporter [Sporomusa sp. KB1]|jgi:drug/metabolite transporter (DMT)-like permease|uniref:DMT family transporter n=1 Tax=Sporomusa sp. KB1 TaxID=943346 RepID=UPI0011A36E02|nr:EamA family transporter [Sporomusa sp. KB1]TWH49469.1 threonine/homoserine efflux transporter RhtA [Sporomusa sp. KB1]
MRKEVYGYFAVIAAACMWGVGGSAAKALFNQNITPFLLVKIRLTLSFLLMLIGLFVYNRRLLVIPRREIAYFALLGTGGMALLQFFYFYTISLTNVATAVFLQYLAPVFMAVYAVVFEKERLGARRGVAIALATLGGFLIMLNAGGGASISVLGLTSGLLAAASMAFSTVYGRRAVRRYHPLTAVTYSFGFAGLFWWLVSPEAWVQGTITTENWWLFAYIAVFSTVIPFLLYFFGIRFLSPTNVGITACLEPVIAAATAYLLLGEVMGLLQMLGGLLVVLAVIVLQTGSEQEALKAAVKKTDIV